MIVFFLGTPAELIKCHPVIRLLEEEGRNLLLIDSGQATPALRAELGAFGYGPSVRVLHLLGEKQQSPVSPAGAFGWFFRVLWAGFRKRKAWSGVSSWVIHGDTLSTLAGAWIGKFWSEGRVAHVEAGMRTGNILEPFPEEITRRLVTRAAQLHFPAHQEAREHLMRVSARGEIIPTEGNTQLAALANVLASPSPANRRSPLGVVNLHRFENMNYRWLQVRRAIESALEKAPLVIVNYSQFRSRLEKDPEFQQRLLRDSRVRFVDRIPFASFVHLLQEASFLLTDGAGNQDDAAAIGIPTFILRERVESRTALWPHGSAVLGGREPRALEDFLRNPEKFRHSPCLPSSSSARIVADQLSARDRS